MVHIFLHDLLLNEICRAKYDGISCIFILSERFWLRFQTILPDLEPRTDLKLEVKAKIIIKPLHLARDILHIRISDAAIQRSNIVQPAYHDNFQWNASFTADRSYLLQ